MRGLIILSLFLVATRIPYVRAVRGCVTYVTGEDYSKRQSICDKPDTHFNTIPPDLPSQVVKLTINHQDIPLLNASQFQHLLNLTDLDLDSNKLRVIRPNTFNQLKYLHSLSLRFNLLTFAPESFHPDVVQGLLQLEHLNLFQNPIRFVPNKFFSPMGSTLRSLVLAGVTSEELHLHPEALDGLRKLQLLDLSSNNIKTLPESFDHTFSNMQLTELYVYDNPFICDCHLRWLKVWFLKYGDRLTYSKHIAEGLGRSVGETTINVWSESEGTSKLLEPKCVEPYNLFGRPLFNQVIPSGPIPVRITDFHCAPQALSPTGPVQLLHGSNSSLSCEFFADPTGIVVWYRNGTRIQSHWPRMSIYQTQGRKFQSTLLIEGVQLEDAGTYMCFLDTGHGRVNTTFTVHVALQGANPGQHPSESVFQWMNTLNTTLVLKYTGIASSCLIILLMCTGLIIYCFYGKRSCQHQQSMSKTSVLQKSSHDSFENEPITEKTNGKQTSCNKNTILVDPPLRPTRSTLISKTAISSTDPKEYLSAPTLSDKQPNPLRANPVTEAVDKYVAIQLVHTEGNNEDQNRCAVHNYTILQPVKADNFLLHGLSTISNTHPIGTAATQCSAPLNDLYHTDQNERVTSPLMVRSNVEGFNFANVVTNVVGMPTQMSSSLDYIPCPLHGNIYATLQNPKKDNLANSKKHIATIPAGLGSGYDRRTNTIPHRAKPNVSGSGFVCTTAQSNPVSSFISAPDVTKSRVEEKRPTGKDEPAIIQ